MTWDELREKIALTLELVADWQGHDKFSLVDTDKAADAVMRVLAEALAAKDAEIERLTKLVNWHVKVGELEMRSHGREEDQLRADMVALRERAVVLPEGWRQQLWSHFDHRETRESRSALNALIESWRPSTGDTDGTAKFDALFPPHFEQGGMLTIRWRDGRQTEHRIVKSEPAGDGITENLTLEPAAVLPEGHTEQARDQT